MTNVIAFKAAARTERPRTDGNQGAGTTAAILFFTGVRYVRDEADAPPEDAKPAKRPSGRARGERRQA